MSYTAKSIPNVSLGTELTIPNVTNVGSAPTLGTAIKCAKVASSATTVATGSLAADGAGSAVVTDVAYDDISVLTGLGTPSTDTFAKTVSVKTQPTISLATGATAGTGVISVATGITSATATGGAYSATGGNVAWNSKDSKTVVATIGTATAAAQTITVGTNDKVTVLKSDTGVTVS